MKSEVLFMIKVPVKSEKKFQRQNIGLEKDWHKFEFFLSINEGVFIPKRTRKEAGSLLMSYLSRLHLFCRATESGSSSCFTYL